MESEISNEGLNEKFGNGSSFSVLKCLTPEQETMIEQKIVTVLKKVHAVPVEHRQKGQGRTIIFTKPMRDMVNPLIEKGARLRVGGFNSIHDTIHERGSFIVNAVDPVLRDFNISFRWWDRKVAETSGRIQSRGSWNNDRTIYKSFGEKLKTDPGVRESI